VLRKAREISKIISDIGLLEEALGLVEMKKRILVVDDDPLTLSMVEAHLTTSGFEVKATLEGSRGIELTHRWKPDLILLDIMMPGMNGFTVTSRIREFSSIPIVMLTAKVEESDKLKGFEAGADDYIVKPLSFPTLLARVRAVLRRCEKGDLEEFYQPSYRHGNLLIDVESYRVTVGGTEVFLSATEFKILMKLAESMGRDVTTKELLSGIWGPGYRNEKTILWVTVSRLKQKIEKDPKNPVHIITVQGVGYTMPKETSYP
jgi:DNA-binding response OmpR family regulator